ncbi:Isoamyl acetate-hydrolyzing esterase 1 [Phytophthora cinnamomi]|uniref:Isoamyl acetate-hydrolyzing esterase 1 n=1 Tax=Phytophthora cinnamomi TaxID=4785 RepID=UPI00355AA6DA|nr:Isoamyl acetate-hydrolyzing esterase 1 [Phytophthora cinnamomi]
MGIFSPDTITDFVRLGDIAGVRRRLELGDDVNERRSFKSTPLIDAASRGNIAIMEILLDHGADLELRDSTRLTALHYAINEKKTAGAIFLARRGASANKVGFMGQTPLQCAIKKKLFDVTAELLANGADPMVRSESKKVARHFIRSGPDHQKFVELLESYTNAEAAIKAKNAGTTPTYLKKSVGHRLGADNTDGLSSVAGAIRAKRPEAVSAILRATISEGDHGVMLSKLRSIQIGIDSADDEEWHSALIAIRDEYEKNILVEVMQSSNALERLKELIEGTGKPDWIKDVKLDHGWTPLHLAASVGSCAIAQYLLVHCGLNPLVVSFNDKLALDIALEGDADNDLCWMLQQHMKKRTFSDRVALILNSEVSVEGLRQLVGHMTSVYDLRHILSLGFRAFSQTEMHSVLLEAFEEVIRERLVFDDRAAVFFKMGLQECRRQMYISEAELVEWDLKATKANVENSEWVRKIKQSLQEVGCRVTAAEQNAGLLHSQFSALRHALIQKEEYELKRRTRDRLISLVSSALAMCGGLVIKDIFGAMFELWDPAKLLGVLTNMSSGKLADFLAERASTIVFKDGVESVLVDSAVDPVEFAAVLREAVKLEQADIAVTAPQMLSPSNTEPLGHLLPPKHTILRFKAVVLAATFRARIEELGDIVDQDLEVRSRIAMMPLKRIITIDDIEFSHRYHAKLLLQTLELMSISEVLLSSQYFDFACSVIYGLYVLVVYHLPNARYILPFIGLTDDAFWTAIVFYGTSAAVAVVIQFTFFIVVRKKFGFSTLFQLAFVLEKYWMSVQGKLIGCMTFIFILHTVHQGMDLSLRRHDQRSPQTPRARLQRVCDSTGTGFVYGTMFGSVLAVIEGMRAAPEGQRLRGALHHAKVFVPETAGRIAMVTCFFRVAAFGIEELRDKRDMWNTLLAAPVAGAMVKVRHGPRAALNSAFAFGSFAAVVVAFNWTESKLMHEKSSPEEVLEEIAFAEEFE